MRLIKIGDHPSSVGEDVRAALTSWSRGDGVVGGIGLIGPTPPGCERAVDAVVLLPRGVLVVVGVDLPDPAMRLEAPLSGPWKTDGWPLVRPDGAVNPGADAMDLSAAITSLLESSRTEPVPVGTVVAVGPYVSQVEQPTADLMRGVRILHPEPMTLLTAVRELAVRERRCTVRQAQQILGALAPNQPTLTEEALLAEGFADAVSPDLSTSRTTLIPRVRDTEPHTPQHRPSRSGAVRWLPIGAAALLALLLATGIVVAIASASDDDPKPAAQTTAQTTTQTSARSTPAPTRPAPTSAGPVSTAPRPGATPAGFTAKGVSQDADCAADTTGDMQTWLQQHGCDRVVRSRYLTAVRGRPAAVLVAQLVFTDAATAQAFQQLADTTGSGTVLDPSAQGNPWPDHLVPDFSSAGYASKVSGTIATITQTTWVTGKATANDPDLAALARTALVVG